MHPDHMAPVSGSRTSPTATVGASNGLHTIRATLRRQARVLDGLTEAVSRLRCVLRELGEKGLLENERMRNRRAPSAGHGPEGTSR
jgi:hypothetical protein